jgi:hypothetical protein
LNFSSSSREVLWFQDPIEGHLWLAPVSTITSQTLLGFVEQASKRRSLPTRDEPLLAAF